MLANLVARQYLFQRGIAAFMIEQVAFLLLALILFRLLHVHLPMAVAMAALAVTAAPIVFVAASDRLGRPDRADRDALKYTGQPGHRRGDAPAVAAGPHRSHGVAIELAGGIVIDMKRSKCARN